MLIENININGKPISIFENHKLAPIPWIQVESQNNIRPAVLTFDHHTDTRLAFNYHIYHQIIREICGEPKYSEMIERAKMKCSSINNIADIEAIIHDLRNDEHIDFSIRANIISHAYVISNNTNAMFTMKSTQEKAWFEAKNRIENIISNNQTPKPQGNGDFQIPENRIIELDNDFFYDFDIYEQIEKCKLYLSDENLSKRLDRIKEINNSIFGGNYDFLNNFILDVDLDYFNTLKSIEPSNCYYFYMLIKRCRAITIAKESWHVNECKLDGESITSDLLLERMLEHIKKATSM